MRAKRRRLVFEAVGPLLEPGEPVEVTAIVNLSTVSAARVAATRAASAAVSTVLSLGALTTIPRRAPFYLVMTDRRVFVFGTRGANEWPGDLQMTIPRAGLVRSKVRERLLNSFFVVLPPGGEQGLKIIFPLPHRSARRAMAAGLPEVG
jgi:hypothetical protein